MPLGALAGPVIGAVGGIASAAIGNSNNGVNSGQQTQNNNFNNTSTTNQTGWTNNNGRTTTSGPGTMAGASALPTYTADWNAARGAAGNAGPQLYTGMTEYGNSIALPVNTGVQAGMDWANGVLQNGYNTDNPFLQQQISSQQALSNNAFTQNARLFRNNAAFGGDLNGTGYNDVAARMVGQQQLGDDARTSNIINQWLQRQQADIHAAPGIINQLATTGSIPYQAIGQGYEAGETNRYNNATLPWQNLLSLDEQYNRLISGIPGSTTDTTQTGNTGATEYGTETGTGNRTDTAGQSLLGGGLGGAALGGALGGLFNQPMSYRPVDTLDTSYRSMANQVAANPFLQVGSLPTPTTNYGVTR